MAHNPTLPEHVLRVGRCVRLCLSPSPSPSVYQFDEEEFRPIEQRTILRSQPLLRIQTTKNQSINDFYQVQPKKSILKNSSDRLNFDQVKQWENSSRSRATTNISKPNDRPELVKEQNDPPTKLQVYIKPFRDQPIERKRLPSRSSNHENILQHYQNLLDRMRKKDEELREISLRLKRKTEDHKSKENEFVSPITIQMFLLLLILFNLLTFYLFHQFGSWWRNSFFSPPDFSEEDFYL